LLRNEKLIAAVPSGHDLLVRHGSLRLADRATDPLIVHPNAPRPSYVDQALALYRDRGFKPPALFEVRDVQTALGLVAACAGMCLVPASVVI
jgi:DNA-binding transcriptional LysR family regulator